MLLHPNSKRGVGQGLRAPCPRSMGFSCKKTRISKREAKPGSPKGERAEGISRMPSLPRASAAPSIGGKLGGRPEKNGQKVLECGILSSVNLLECAGSLALDAWQYC